MAPGSSSDTPSGAGAGREAARGDLVPASWAAVISAVWATSSSGVPRRSAWRWKTSCCRPGSLTWRVRSARSPRRCPCWRGWRSGRRRRRPSGRRAATAQPVRPAVMTRPGQGPDETWSRAAAGLARARPAGLLPSAGPRGDPRRPRGRAGVPALRRGLRPVRRRVLRADRLAGAADPDRAPAPDLPAHLRVPGPRGPGRATGAQGDRQGPVHHGVSGPAAGGEVRAGPPRAPDRRRAGPRRARPGRGHPGRGVRGVRGPAGPAGRR